LGLRLFFRVSGLVDPVQALDAGRRERFISSQMQRNNTVGDLTEGELDTIKKSDNGQTNTPETTPAPNLVPPVDGPSVGQPVSESVPSSPAEPVDQPHQSAPEQAVQQTPQQPVAECKSPVVESSPSIGTVPLSSIVVSSAKPQKPFTSLTLIVLLVVSAAALAWFFGIGYYSPSSGGGGVVSDSTTATSPPIVTSTTGVPSNVLPVVDIDGFSDPRDCAVLDFNLRDQCYMRIVQRNGTQEAKMACMLIKGDFLRANCLSLGLEKRDIADALAITSSAFMNLSLARCEEIRLPPYRQECVDVVSVVSKAYTMHNKTICLLEGNISSKSRMDCLNWASMVARGGS
jgi:hypothetical protein